MNRNGKIAFGILAAGFAWQVVKTHAMVRNTQKVLEHCEGIVTAAGTILDDQIQDAFDYKFDEIVEHYHE